MATKRDTGQDILIRLGVKRFFLISCNYFGDFCSGIPRLIVLITVEVFLRSLCGGHVLSDRQSFLYYHV